MLARVFVRLARHSAYLFFPSMAMAWFFLDAWVAPDDADPAIIKVAFASIILEFVVIHSAAFFVEAAGSRTRFVLWTLFYSATVIPLAIGLAAEWPFVAFLAHAVSIYRGNANDLMARGPHGEAHPKMRWVVMGAAWFFAFMVGHMAPMPELGLTADAFSRLDTDSLTPQAARGVLAAAFLYYSLMSVFELVWGFLRAKRALELPPVDMDRPVVELLRPRGFRRGGRK